MNVSVSGRRNHCALVGVGGRGLLEGGGGEGWENEILWHSLALSFFLLFQSSASVFWRTDDNWACVQVCPVVAGASYNDLGCVAWHS